LNKLENLTKFAKLLVKLKAFRVYSLKSSNKFGGFLWNWLNPLSYILAPLMFTIQGFIEGFPEAWKNRHELGFRINPWYKDKEIEWS
jgi:hypothetical protein